MWPSCSFREPFLNNICVIILSGVLLIQTSVFEVWDNFHFLKRVPVQQSRGSKLLEHKHTGIITCVVMGNTMRLFVTVRGVVLVGTG